MAVLKNLDGTNLHAHVVPETGDKLKKIAYILGYIYMVKKVKLGNY
ncbi:hypothetical protein NIES4071_39020 [Calothrix sp. NIES-4071]|nr:hypothetical protein NIES4071_39020 [Calothrix sp. NIES-4071]BAZ58220.1 hypothetical protein NIES4105_38960 [Calothrix sp. NIES-4105]